MRDRPIARRVAPALVTLATALLAPTVARSTTVEQLPFDRLVAQAETAFHGTCVDVRAEWDATGRRIRTRVTFAPQDTLKGPNAERFELVLPGGQRDGLTQVVHGMPRFAVGDEVVLLATAPHRRSGVRVPVGLAQGVYRVERHPGEPPIARRDTRGLHLVDLDARRAVPGKHEAIPLEDLLEQVRGEVARQRRAR